MKKIIKIFLLIFSIFLSINETLSYFNTTDNLSNIFKTKDYVLKLNANGGYFNTDSIIVKNNSTTLPTPNRTGYTFLGFSDSPDGNANYSTTINNIDSINNKDLYSKWNVITYNIDYNLNGGVLSNQKNNYTVEDTFTLAIPTKDGYTFSGWTGTDLNSLTNEVTISNVTGNRNYTANWNINSYVVDVNPIIDGIYYGAGLSGYTFDVYINGNLVADDVIDFYQYVEYGNTVRVKANNLTGHSTTYDETIVVGNENISISPTWGINTYESHFYYNNTSGNLTFWTATYNKFGSYISTPAINNVSQFGYDDNFYKFVDFTAWTTWYQPDYAVGFTVNIGERSCRATFGTLSVSNANAQQNKFHNAGYDYCNVNVNNTREVECKGTSSQVLKAYNNAWNILPKNGSGFSAYKDMSCDSGYSTYATR